MAFRPSLRSGSSLTFARMEFALKQCRYLRSTDDGVIAQRARIRGYRENANVAETLIAVPPKHFVVNDEGGIQFGEHRFNSNDIRFGGRNMARPEQSF